MTERNIHIQEMRSHVIAIVLTAHRRSHEKTQIHMYLESDVSMLPSITLQCLVQKC